MIGEKMGFKKRVRLIIKYIEKYESNELELEGIRIKVNGFIPRMDFIFNGMFLGSLDVGYIPIFKLFKPNYCLDELEFRHFAKNVIIRIENKFKLKWVYKDNDIKIKRKRNKQKINYELRLAGLINKSEK